MFDWGEGVGVDIMSPPLPPRPPPVIGLGYVPLFDEVVEPCGLALLCS